MNQNYATMVKRDLDKLLSASFIALVEEVNWLSPIVVVPKKSTWISNSMLHPLLKRCWMKWWCIYEVYLFLDGFFNNHQIMIAHKNRYKTTFITD
jgi:hypothetical protein